MMSSAGITTDTCCHNPMAARLQQGQGDQACTLTRLICHNRGSQKAGVTVKATRVPPEDWKEHLNGFKMALTVVRGPNLSHLKFVGGLGEDEPKEPRGHEEPKKSSLRPPTVLQPSTQSRSHVHSWGHTCPFLLLHARTSTHPCPDVYPYSTPIPARTQLLRTKGGQFPCYHTLNQSLTHKVVGMLPIGGLATTMTNGTNVIICL